MNRSGLAALVEHVTGYVAARQPGTSVVYGKRERAKQTNQGDGGANRIAFKLVPKKPHALSGAKWPGGSPARSLVTWERLVEVSVWAADANDPNDETLQLQAVEDLLEVAVQAIHDFGRADIVFLDVTPNEEPVERSFGVELVMTFKQKGPLFDEQLETQFPDPAVQRGTNT